MALPAAVADDELIEADWGNNVVDSLAAVGMLRRFVATRGTSQTMTGGTYTTIVFSAVTQNTIPLSAGPPVSIPSGAAGCYSILFRLTASASMSGGIIRLTIGSTTFNVPAPALTMGFISLTAYLDPSTTIACSVFVPSTLTCDNAVLEINGHVPVLT